MKKWLERAIGWDIFFQVVIILGGVIYVLWSVITILISRALSHLL